MPRLHDFDIETKGMELPRQFTFPFHYTPHPLCVEAARQVQRYVASRPDWASELERGKMLGVLVVMSPQCDRPQFLAAFSGILAGSNDHPYFVPAVYDLLDPQGEFKQGEAKITAINHQIDAMSKAPSLVKLRERLADATSRGKMTIASFKEQMARAKERRDAARQAGNVTPAQHEQMLNESRFMKAELKRLRQRVDNQVDECKAAVAASEQEIQGLKARRKAMSEALQQRIFRLFVVEDAQGNTSDLTDIFQNTEGKLPPGGAGECCAPKLLHYAYRHGLKPLCMAEFWWGASPQGEVRHHGHYYPACRSKCKPILDFMLQGLDVESNSLAQPLQNNTMKVIHDDRWLTVVDKPSGMLSVPGKELEDSVYTRYRQQFPEATGPIVVHRLDQETSGLLVLAKDKETHKALQQQFASHTITKRYVALLDGEVTRDEGTIDLPLRPDVDDRPRQMVDPDHGKPATTRYHVIERRGGHTLVEFFPLTGRTHQLRVHSSHPQGLNAPIHGDRLYGTASTRLMLHAQRITFTHPATGQTVTLESPVPFIG